MLSFRAFMVTGHVLHSSNQWHWHRKYGNKDFNYFKCENPKREGPKGRWLDLLVLDKVDWLFRNDVGSSCMSKKNNHNLSITSWLFFPNSELESKTDNIKKLFPSSIATDARDKSHSISCTILQKIWDMNWWSHLIEWWNACNQC